MTSPLLDIPYMRATQVQKEITHNEAVNILEASLNVSVVSERDIPPGAPDLGDRYLVGQNPEEAFAGHAGELAAWYSGWVFVRPQEGWIAYDRDTSRHLTFDGDQWVSLLPPVQPTGMLELSLASPSEFLSPLDWNSHLVFRCQSDLPEAHTLEIDGLSTGLRHFVFVSDDPSATLEIVSADGSVTLSPGETRSVYVEQGHFVVV